MEVITHWIDPTIEEQQKEIDRLKKKENDLIEAYRTAYKALQKKGVASDIVDYMMAQVDDCPTFTVEEPDYKRMYFEEVDKRQVAIGYIDQVLQYHLNTIDKQVDEDINTLVGILAGFKGYYVKYKDINNLEYWRDMYYKLNDEYKEKIGSIKEILEEGENNEEG